MNIVKGVADLLRRSSGGQGGESPSWARADKLSVPSPKICFGDVGEEAILNTLWQKYENTVDKSEKRKLLQVFLMHFIQTYCNWEPADNVEQAAFSIQTTSARFSTFENAVIGCSFGHPSEVILILIQEISRITSLVTDYPVNLNASLPIPIISEPSASLNFSTEALHALKSMTLVTRSMHNCRVFSYYGGVQKVTALMKATVIQLRTLSGGIAVSDCLSASDMETIDVLLKMLLYVVSTIFNFMFLHPDISCRTQHISSKLYFLNDYAFWIPRSIPAEPISEARVDWQKKAIVLVMEAGGVNWLVELLRVIRRINLKEGSPALPLQYLALSTLRSVLSQNTRAQNHFRSIGGLEVLLDELMLSRSNYLFAKSPPFESERCGRDLSVYFQLHILSLEVLRESIFGNLNNLQFLCENGRIQKFANSICSLAFILQEFMQDRILLPESFSVMVSNSTEIYQDCSKEPSLSDDARSCRSNWTEYCIQLSRMLFSFLLPDDDVNAQHRQPLVTQVPMPVSFAYWEFSIKWVIKVLLAIFPCIKACSSEDKLPAHLRFLANTLQHSALHAFREFLTKSPKLLEVFREEGIWDLIFSEKLFYFSVTFKEYSEEIISSPEKHLQTCDLPSKVQHHYDVDILQIEAVSFLEFAATLGSNNLPECSILVETLEQSACKPKIAIILVKSLHRIFQLSTRQSTISFEKGDAVARVLRVACIQAEERRKFVNFNPYSLSDFDLKDVANKWVQCMDASLDLFAEYLLVADVAKRNILHNMTCIACLFDLLWEEEFRKQVLDYILGLMKLQTSTEDRVAKLQLCSKYLEAFTLAKERDLTELLVDLLIGMREVLLLDKIYYQALFREVECFLHIVSLLNATPDEKTGEELVVNVLQTLTLLLSGNDVSKYAFKTLVGVGYQMLQRVLLDFCRSRPSLQLLNVLLDMLLDEKYDTENATLIKNEDVIMLFLSILHKSSDFLQQYGLDIIQNLVKDSITNRAMCFRAGILSFLLDWFSTEENDDIVIKLAELIQIVGGHSVSGKDIRKIFALLRSEKIGFNKKSCSLLLTSVQSMLKAKGPTAFFEFNGYDSGIAIKTPVQWPYNKGFSFSCWLRIESFPENGLMGLFNFCTDSGKGSFAMLGKEKLFFESVNQKRQSVTLSLNLLPKKWHFLCITHSIGRAFSGGSLLSCYIDGNLASYEKCRYAKVTDALTCCNIGMRISHSNDQCAHFPINDPFLGQIGPIYMFSDSLSSEQVKRIYRMGPSFMYSSVKNEAPQFTDNSLSSGLLDLKDGSSAKIMFGLNAQASDGRTLFNVSSALEHMHDKNLFEAAVMTGTQLCSRRILQEIIYCVGGVSVFFPLLTQLGRSEAFAERCDHVLFKSMMIDKLVSEVIELVTSVLDENLANQQQMYLLSGFSIMGLLFQSLPPQHLNMDTLLSLKNLLHVLRKTGMPELLLKDALSQIYLNPRIWVYANYEVQRELYMFLIEHFENDTSQLAALCGFSQTIDIICQFYWDKAESPLAFGLKPLLHSTTGQIIGERPCREEIRKIRLLLLSLAELSLKQKIDSSNIKALIAFFEKSRDTACIEDVLQVVMRALSQKPLLYSFLDQVNLLGGCQVFINLLQRDFEQVRLLSLQFMAKLLVGQPSDKKVQKLFNLSVGRIKSLSESQKKGGNNRLEPLFQAMSDRLFKFPLSDDLCATLFDMLLGGASPKQVLQKHALSEKTHSNRSSQFILPQTLILIFKFLESCQESSTRERILKDLLNLFDSNPSNIEALMEKGWYPWLVTSVRLNVIRNYEVKAEGQAAYSTMNECYLVRNVYCIVLSHCLYSVKGGWQYLEETVNFLILHSQEGKKLSHNFIRDIFKDLVGSLLYISPAENCFVSQPCRDNTYYLLKIIDDMLISEIGDKYLFPYCVLGSTVFHEDAEPESQKDITKSLFDVFNDEGEDSNQLPRTAWNCDPLLEEDIQDSIKEDLWNFYDSLWALICEMNGKGSKKMFSKASIVVAPSLGQRARDLVESLNIPAAEMAAAVVSGGISGALSGKATKYVDKAMLLRGERCLRFVFRLVMLYVCGASLERVSKCVQQFVSLLPHLLSFEEELHKDRLQLYIWSLLKVRSKYRMQNDDARFRITSQLVLDMVNHGKALLTVGDGQCDPSSILMDAGFINDNMFQKERVVHAVIDERKYIKSLRNDRLSQIQEICVKMSEDSTTDFNQKNAIEEEILTVVNTIVSLDDNRRASNQFAYDEEQQITAEKWIHMFRTLVDERGPWSSNVFPNNNLIRWKHDKTEDIWRRRPKLKRNYHFDEKLCHPPTATSTKDTSDSFSESQIGNKSFPEKMKHFLLKGVRGIDDEGSAEPCEDYGTNNSLSGMASDPDISSRGQHHGLAYDYRDQTDIAQDRRSSSSYSANVEPSEVLLSIPTVLVSPKRKVAGNLSVMQSILHFSGEFLVEGTGGSSVFQGIHILSNSYSIQCDQLGRSNGQKLHRVPLRSELNTEKDDGKKNMNHDGALLNNCKKVKRHRRWKVAKIKSVHWTRYLLQYTAIEIFFEDSITPIFLNFVSPKDAKNVGMLIVNARNEALFPKGSSRDKAGIISFVDRRVAAEMAETSRERWRRREISNFEYLMILNTLAGRSYNDLTQYPVFPWVLADYTSEKLDLNKSSSFRDLSKPVGALDLKRFEVFEDRYRNFCDPDIPSFYYGSHYSSMGIVLFYLLRLEPFTTLHRNLQGGKFDHADRLFQSIEGTWRNCLSNTSDVKELIPEFFYMPEFLMNTNSYHLGVKQDGEPLADVSLPPWAKGSPEEFIYRHREALESEYVSSNLHHWIDLIFGYKQRGKPAVEAANVFYYLTYEGAVDLDSMDDDLQRSAIEDQIANFGQTPIQIFRKKHPRRGPPNPIAHPLYFAPASITLTSVVSNTVHSHSSVVCIGLIDSNIVIVYEGLYLTVKIWLTTQLQSGGNLTFSSSQDPFFGIGSDILYPHKIGTPLADNIELNAQCFAVLQTASENYLISCGCWDNSFQLISLNDGKITQSIRQHKDVVSCVAVTSDGSVLATGSYDTTVMVWDVNRIRTTEKRFRGIQTELSSKDRVIAESPSHILCGHDDIVTCLFVSTELDIVISGSKDGTCIFHTLRDGRYVRSIQHPSGSPLSKLAGSRDGRVVLYSEHDLSLHMYSINGKHIASCESNGRLNCIELSSRGEFIICAGDHGQIILRSMHSLEVLRQYEGIGKAITSLVVTPEDCFLAGTKDGSLLVYSVENPQLRRSSLPRNTKSK